MREADLCQKKVFVSKTCVFATRKMSHFLEKKLSLQIGMMFFEEHVTFLKISWKSWMCSSEIFTTTRTKPLTSSRILRVNPKNWKYAKSSHFSFFLFFFLSFLTFFQFLFSFVSFFLFHFSKKKVFVLLFLSFLFFHIYFSSCFHSFHSDVDFAFFMCPTATNLTLREKKTSASKQPFQ